MPLTVTLGHASLTGPRACNEDFVGAVTPEGALRTTPAMLPLEAPFASGLDGFYAVVLRRLA